MSSLKGVGEGDLDKGAGNGCSGGSGDCLVPGGGSLTGVMNLSSGGSSGPSPACSCLGSESSSGEGVGRSQFFWSLLSENMVSSMEGLCLPGFCRLGVVDLSLMLLFSERLSVNNLSMVRV